MGKAKANAGLLARRPVCLLATVQNTHELKVDYTHTGSCDKFFETTNVFFYFGDDGQMLLQLLLCQTLPVCLLYITRAYCEPFIKGNNGLPIAPCWAMANTMFNVVHVHLFRKGIPWYTDKNVKCRNPPDENKTRTLKPVFDLDPWDHNNGFINEDLIVWMREAAFPNFKELYGVPMDSLGRKEVVLSSQLVRESEQLPARSLPDHWLSHPAPRCYPHRHLVEVW
uniref:Transmembrane protein 30C n=1 Tax=Oncorhynchus kisutch TaxID=8019 RepID=A0A8C7I4G3_ONCKI